MCGRYTYFRGEFSDLRLTWNVDEVFGLNLKPRYNIAPSQDAPVITQADGKRTIELFQWGLIPSWAKDPAIGNKMINARGETIAEKPSFKWLLARRRCLVLADGFYEWRKEGKQKVPMRFKLKSGPPYSSWCWYPKGSVLKDGRLGSVIEIGRIEDNGITFDIKALAVWYGMELSRIAVDECLTPE